MNKSFAFVFPGQGSQSVGMLAELASSHRMVTDTFSEASDALGYDLWQLVQEGPAEKLNQTQYTQPALLAAGVAVYHVWLESCDVEPTLLAGHSLGEYTALVCARALDFKTAIQCVAERGRLMQEAVPPGVGAMAAIIGLDALKVQSVCEMAMDNDIVQAANLNSPGQIVVAGDTAAVERAIDIAKKEGAKIAKKLPVSVPSHCALMKPAAEKLAQYLENISLSPLKMPVIHNVDVAEHHDPKAIKTALVQQLSHPVRWIETINTIKERGAEFVVECGPGKVLCGLNKRIDKQLKCFAMNDTQSLEDVLTQVRN